MERGLVTLWCGVLSHSFQFRYHHTPSSSVIFVHPFPVCLTDSRTVWDCDGLKQDEGETSLVKAYLFLVVNTFFVPKENEHSYSQIICFLSKNA